MNSLVDKTRKPYPPVFQDGGRRAKVATPQDLSLPDSPVNLDIQGCINSYRA